MSKRGGGLKLSVIVENIVGTGRTVDISEERYR